MDESHWLREILLLIALAAVGVAVFERLRLPAIAGFLLTGAAVGPGGLALVDDPARVHALAEFGVVFLLFEIGLELPLERLRRLWRRAFLAGGLQVGLTVGCVAGAALGLGLPGPEAFVLGALVAMSSTALVMRVLSERGEIDAPQGQLAVGVLLFQDLCIVPFLLVVPILANPDGGLMLAIGGAVLRVAGALAVFALLVRVVLPRLLDRFAVLRSPDLFTLLAVLVVLGSAVLAEEIGLTLAVGAFVAGLVASASPYAPQLFADVVPLRGVLLGLFFTAVGMLLDARAALAAWPLVIGYVAAVVLAKAGIVAFVVGGVLRQGPRLGVLTGLSLAQTGEFSFVLAGVAAAAGLLQPGAEQAFVAGSVLTLVMTPFLVQLGPRITDALALRELRPAGDAAEPSAHADHVLLIGFGLAGRTLARVLRGLEIPYTAVEANARAVAEAREQNEPVLYGDATRPALLERAGIARARLVVVSVNDPATTQQVVAIVRSQAPHAGILVRTRYVLEVDALVRRGASTVVAEEIESTLALLGETLRAFGTPEGAAARFVQELREEGYEVLRAPVGVRLDPWLVELLEQVQADWVSVPEGFLGEATLADLEIRSRTGATVLAVDRDGRGTPSPAADFRLRAADRLLVSGTPDALQRLEQLLSEPRQT